MRSNVKPSTPTQRLTTAADTGKVAGAVTRRVASGRYDTRYPAARSAAAGSSHGEIFQRHRRHTNRPPLSVAGRHRGGVGIGEGSVGRQRGR
jgi:hypothetical protein